MVSKIFSAQLSGLTADIVEIEVDISRGLHSFSIVGLPDKSVKEAQDRINAAIKNADFKTPQKSSNKIIVSLAPAEIKKEGSAYDLGIALAYLLASGEIKFDARKKLFLGELALSGAIRPIKGSLLLAKKAKEAGFEDIYLPEANAEEASLIDSVNIYGCKNLKEIVAHLSPKPEEGDDVPFFQLTPTKHQIKTGEEISPEIDFSDIRGQETAKRGLEIAAAGGHNIAMYGPPGTGKTMLAKAFAGILPPLSFDQIIETTGIHSAAGTLRNALVSTPPFRSPHHTSSYVAIVGGGAWPKPGEVTLANRGVLFLDEFPEFDKKVIEAMRQPLEDRIVSISRAKATISFPADFILVAAMNPCPCGYKGSRLRECICNQSQLFKYQRKVSGPIVDRIDLWLEVPYIDPGKLSGTTEPKGESSNIIRERVLSARQKQTDRFANARSLGKTNASMSVRELEKFAPLSAACKKILDDSAKRLALSARAYHRIIKMSRTIADLAGSENISENHLLEALQYRPKNSL